MKYTKSFFMYNFCDFFVCFVYFVLRYFFNTNHTKYTKRILCVLCERLLFRGNLGYHVSMAAVFRAATGRL
jgi:hypothetical protein